MEGAAVAVAVGVAVFVVRGESVLIGRRLTPVGLNTFALPGGHLEFGETWEECAAREVMEETGLSITKIEFVTVTNNIMLDEVRPCHYVVIFMRGELSDLDQNPQNLEPEKCDGWEWVEWNNLPNFPMMKPLKALLDTGFSLFPSR